MRARLSTALYVCVAAAVLTAQQAPPRDPQQPTFRAGANFVRVDMYATTRDGQFVEDLKPDEIELREDGVAQQIDSFEYVHVRGASAEATRIEPLSASDSRQAATDPRARVFVIFLDTYHTTIEGSATMRLPLIRFLDRVLGPDDLVAVMTPEMSAGDLAFGRKTTVISNIMQTQWDWGRRGRLDTLDPKDQVYEFCYPNEAAVVTEMKARRHEKLTLDALDDLITVLTGLREERKAVLTVTEGWMQYRESKTLATLPRDSGGNPIAQPPDLVGRAPRGRVEGRSSGTTGSMRAECEADRLALAMLDHRDRLRRITDDANRGNVAFYPVYARGLVVFDSPIGPEPPPPPAVDAANLAVRQEALRYLADQTDGLAIVNTNNISNGIDRIVSDLSSYYLLGYYSTNSKLDGKFRTINVRVKRPGVQVRARRGYRGLTADEVLAGGPSTAPGATASSTDTLSQAFNTVAGLNARALFRVRASSWVPPTSGEAAAGTVWLIGELDYKTRRELSWSSGGEADVAVVGVDGNQVLSKTLQVPAADGTFAIRIPDAGTLAPGEYAVRVRVRPQADPSLPVSDIARVQVPSATSPIGEAVLWRRGPSTGLRYSMTADPRFMRTERVRLELPTRLTTMPTARLLDRAGKPMSVPVQLTERTDAGADFNWVVADVQLAPLAAGDYAIEVTIDGVKQVTGFRVIP